MTIQNAICGVQTWIWWVANTKSVEELTGDSKAMQITTKHIFLNSKDMRNVLYLNIYPSWSFIVLWQSMNWRDGQLTSITIHSSLISQTFCLQNLTQSFHDSVQSHLSHIPNFTESNKLQANENILSIHSLDSFADSVLFVDKFYVMHSWYLTWSWLAITSLRLKRPQFLIPSHSSAFNSILVGFNVFNNDDL